MAVSSRNRVTIEVDRQLCYGFGDCVDTAPAVFALDDARITGITGFTGYPELFPLSGLPTELPTSPAAAI